MSMTLEQAIASYEKSAERYHKSFLQCKAHGGEFYQAEAKSNKICYEYDRQFAAWLRELQERRKQPEIIRCKDCKHYKIDHPKANGYHCCYRCHNIFPMKEDDFCSRAERRPDDKTDKGSSC